MPYKQQFYRKIEFKKSVVVGIVVLILDMIGHILFTARPETLYYYALKPIISGYVSYYMFKYKFNIFNLKKNSTQFYVYYSLLFSLVHGIYYRILDFVQGNPFWSRVQDVAIGNIVWSRNNFGSSILAWAIIHAGSFLLGIVISDFLVRKKWLK